MAVRVDLNYFPLVLVSHEGVSTDDEFEAHLEVLRGSLTSKDASRRVLVIDATHAGLATPATQRKRQAEWMKENEAHIRRLTIGCAFVIPSSVIRGFLTAIFWIQPLPCPHVVTSTLEEAFVWSEKRLAESGLGFPLGARTAWLPGPGAARGTR